MIGKSKIQTGGVIGERMMIFIGWKFIYFSYILLS